MTALLIVNIFTTTVTSRARRRGCGPMTGPWSLASPRHLFLHMLQCCRGKKLPRLRKGFRLLPQRYCRCASGEAAAVPFDLGVSIWVHSLSIPFFPLFMVTQFKGRAAFRAHLMTRLPAPPSECVGGRQVVLSFLVPPPPICCTVLPARMHAAQPALVGWLHGFFFC